MEPSIDTIVNNINGNGNHTSPSNEDDKILWRQIDNSEKSKEYIDYVDKCSKNEMFIYVTRITISNLKLKPGQTIVDLGCGAGKDLIALEKQVGKEGQVIGVDLSQEMVNCSKTRVAQYPNIKIHCLPADNTGFESSSVDCTRCERLLQHVPNPEQVIDEMVRITKNGGRVSVTDTDWQSTRVSCSGKFEKICWAIFHQAKFNAHPDIGINLRSYFQKNGNIKDIQVQGYLFVATSLEEANGIYCFYSRAQVALEQNLITAQELAEFKQEMERLDKEGSFVISNSLFTIHGTVSKQI
eukprot:gene6225-7754_t